MTDNDIYDIIDILRDKAELNKLVVFVGAGVSCNVDKMPSWDDLINDMAKSINYNKCSSCKSKTKNCYNTCLLKNSFSTDEFLKIPQYLYNKNHKAYYKKIKDNIADIKKPTPMASAIFDINPSQIITTNYDFLLESSDHPYCQQYEVIAEDKDLLESTRSKYIIKMHGDLSDVENIVLKEQDYLDYSQNHVLIELFIKSLLTDHIVLFLGYSLNDYNIKLIISWVNYMRSQNKVLKKGQWIGYIVLNSECINKIQLEYFRSNNIQVININTFPQIKEIPEELPEPLGTRLYSFLKVIGDESLKDANAHFTHAVSLMKGQIFLDYKTILKLLDIKQYKFSGDILTIISYKYYNEFIKFLKSDTPESNQLKQLFINSGILTINRLNYNQQRYKIGEMSENELLKNKFFETYLHDDYTELNKLLDDNSLDYNIKVFTSSF